MHALAVQAQGEEVLAAALGFARQRLGLGSAPDRRDTSP
jgi:hypothetical protein